MALLNHWHATMGIAPGNCTTMGGHPTGTSTQSCTRSPFTIANEVSCTRTTGGPTGRPFKCVHDVPSSGPGGSGRRAPAKGKRRPKPRAKRAKPVKRTKPAKRTRRAG